MLNIFKSQPLLDDDTRIWLYDVYAWALNNFSRDVFHNETQLVLPNNHYFPMQSHDPHELSKGIFESVKQQAGMQNWPCIAVDEHNLDNTLVPQLEVQGEIRGKNNIVVMPSNDSNIDQLPVIYNIAFASNPQAMIANYAHSLAMYLGSTAQQEPPGGKENWPHVTEVLGVFLGFGLMFANSALNVRIQACGSCQLPIADRTSYLSQYDISYALAIFSVLKQIDKTTVLPHLKKSLRPYFKKAIKEVQNDHAATQPLLSI